MARRAGARRGATAGPTGAIALVVIVLLGSVAVPSLPRKDLGLPPGSGSPASAGPFFSGEAIRSGPDPSARPPAAPPAAVGTAVGAGWWNLTGLTSAQPGARTGASLTYDPDLHATVLFGGAVRGVDRNDTWSYSRGAWTQLAEPRAPSPRAHAATAYDASDRLLLLFGGEGATVLGDTWALRNGSWEPLNVTGGPSARWAAMMASDTVDQTVLLFGGFGPSGTGLNDSWTFGGGIWRAVPAGSAPAPRGLGSLVDDPPDHGALLVGGANASGGRGLNDTWRFGAGHWTPIAANSALGRRAGASIALDPVGSAVLLFGGYDPATSTRYSDLWQYTNGSWGAIVTPRTPPPRANASVDWDASGGYLLMIGGDNGSGAFSDTWAYASAEVGFATVDHRTTDVGWTVEFEGSASGGIAPYSYTWQSSLGAGPGPTPSSGWNATFRKPGLVAVSLLVTDLAGARSLAYLNVTVEPDPTVAIHAPPSATDVGVPTTLLAMASGGVVPLGIVWTFGDGYRAAGASADHAFRVAGITSVAVTVRDALGANSTANLALPVHPIPRATPALGSTAPTVGLPVEFDGSVTGGDGAIQVRWDFGDGSSATGAVVNHTYAQPGLYEALANASDHLGASSVSVIELNVSPARAASSSSPALAPYLAAIGAAALGLIGWTVRRRRALRARRSREPGPETGEPFEQDLADPEVAPGGGEQDDEPECREGGVP
ncbi:MAG TPA: PKD domain-containing protein [Thermoplasmata archaeon]|nr:PKD domain-containing protein [Thermoplasmata archaeon]